MMEQLGHIDKHKWFSFPAGKGVSCLHMNVQSACNKLGELETFFDDINDLCDVIMLCETWHSNNVNILRLQQKQTFCLNRTTRRGGGVSLLVKNLIPCDILEDFTIITHNVESLCIQADGIIFGVCYRPPDGSMQEFLTFVDRLLAYACENKQKVILGGDYNIDMSVCSARHHDLLNIMLSNGCINVTESSTRITMSSETTLDLFITNYDPSYVKKRCSKLPSW